MKVFSSRLHETPYWKENNKILPLQCERINIVKMNFHRRIFASRSNTFSEFKLTDEKKKNNNDNDRTSEWSFKPVGFFFFLSVTESAPFLKTIKNFIRVKPKHQNVISNVKAKWHYKFIIDLVKELLNFYEIST